jgi:dipeptide/tripeptide permease
MAGFAISELLLSPIGLSVTTELAPEAFRAQMMALYFFLRWHRNLDVGGRWLASTAPTTKSSTSALPARSRSSRDWLSLPCHRW